MKPKKPSQTGTPSTTKSKVRKTSSVSRGVVKKKTTSKSKKNAANKSITSLGSLTDTTMQQNETELSIEPIKLQRLDLGAIINI